jgi:hypothetical protein
MTGNDLIVAAPWIIFGAGLSAVWIRLLRARHASGHRPGRSLSPFPGPGGSGGAEPGRCGRAMALPHRGARRSAGKRPAPPDPQEGQCAEKNMQARWR